MCVSKTTRTLSWVVDGQVLARALQRRGHVVGALRTRMFEQRTHVGRRIAAMSRFVDAHGSPADFCSRARDASVRDEACAELFRAEWDALWHAARPRWPASESRSNVR